jgi:hypothetical protein
MTPELLMMIRDWDKRCGANEGTMFQTTVDRRRLLEYVDELRLALTGMVDLIALVAAGRPLVQAELLADVRYLAALELVPEDAK